MLTLRSVTVVMEIAANAKCSYGNLVIGAEVTVAAEQQTRPFSGKAASFPYQILYPVALEVPRCRKNFSRAGMVGEFRSSS